MSHAPNVARIWCAAVPTLSGLEISAMDTRTVVDGHSASTLNFVSSKLFSVRPIIAIFSAPARASDRAIEPPILLEPAACNYDGLAFCGMLRLCGIDRWI